MLEPSWKSHAVADELEKKVRKKALEVNRHSTFSIIVLSLFSA